MKRTALVTGAGGFLARHVAATFRDAGWRLVGVGRADPDGVAARYDHFQLNDLSDTNRILDLLEKFAPSLLLHTAAPASVPASLERPLADLEAHVIPTARLLEALRLSGSHARLLLLSSAAVYGQPETLPVTESAPTAPLSPYGFHKLQQELICDEYLRVFQIPAVKARLFSIFGEGLRRLAVWDLTRRALAGESLVMGTGGETRDYLYVADVADAILAIAERAPFDGRSINVASGDGITIDVLARHIYAKVGLHDAPQFSGAATPGLPSSWIADVTRLRELGWSPRRSLDEGLTRTIDWIRAHA